MRNAPAPIRALLNRAANETEAYGFAFADTEQELAAEGYMLSALDRDVQSILAARAD